MNGLAIKIDMILMLVGFILATYFESQNIPEYPKPRPLLNLARAYQQRRELDKAAPLYKELLSSPRSDEPANWDVDAGDYAGAFTYRDLAGVNLAAIYTDGGLFEEAERLLESLHQAPEVVTNRAVILLRQRRPAEALPLFEAIRDFCNRRASCLYNYGQAFHALGLCDRAREQYGKAWKLNPDLPQPPCQ